MNISSNFAGIPGGVLMSIIAFSIVFIVIAGLILLMYGLKALAAAIDSAGSSAAAPAESTQVKAAVPAVVSAQPAPAVMAAASDDDELIAVLTAAVMAVCGTVARVVSFREAPRASASTVWKTTGRLQNCEGFAD